MPVINGMKLNHIIKYAVTQQKAPKKVNNGKRVNVRTQILTWHNLLYDPNNYIPVHKYNLMVCGLVVEFINSVYLSIISQPFVFTSFTFSSFNNIGSFTFIIYHNS